MDETPQTHQQRRRRWLVWGAIAGVYAFPLVGFHGFAKVYLKLGSIEGEVTAKGYEDWIEVDEASDGVSRLISMPPRMATGPPLFTEVTLKKKPGIASPAIFLEAVTGSITPNVSLAFSKVPAPPAPAVDRVYFKVEIEGVYVSSMSTEVLEGGTTTVETFTLNFDKIQKTVTQFDSAGDHVAEVTAFWDLDTMSGGLTLNTAPTISDILDTNTEEDIPKVVNFIVGDAETAPGLLVLSGSSTNPTLVPVANIVFGGADANRDATITPAPDQTGMTTITIEASDGSLTTMDAFVLTVDPEVFDQWRRDHFDAAELLDPAISGLLGDADVDRLKNIGEYALGTAAGVSLDPKNGEDAGSAVTLVMVDDGGMTYPALLFNRRKSSNDPDLTITVEQAEDLTGWGSGAGFTEEVQVVSINATFEQALVRSAKSMDDEPRQSMRIRFTR
jgi:type VI protein secretion system component Hcp